ncbi:porin [Caldithrix abyssi]
MSNRLFIMLIASMFINSFALAQGGSQNQTLPKIGVWIMSNYEYDTTEDIEPNSSFGVKHARLLFKGQTTDKMGYHAMVELVGPADKKPLLMQAWVSYTVSSFLKFRMGQFKYPFGYEAYPGRIYWKFLNPSYVTAGIVKKLGMTGGYFRDIGVEAAGEYALADNFSAIYKFMVFNGTGVNARDVNSSKDYAAFIGARLPETHLTLAGSFYRGKSLSDGTESEESAYGILLKFSAKKITAQAEYITAFYDAVNSDFKKEPAGFYVSGTYRFTQNIEVGLRYDQYEDDQNTANSTKTRYTFMGGYYFNKQNRIILNYEIRKDDLNHNIGDLFTVQLQTAL